MIRNGNASSVGTATHPVNIYFSHGNSFVKRNVGKKVYSIIPEPAVGKTVISGKYGLGKITSERNDENRKIYSVRFHKKGDPVYFSYEEIKTMLYLKTP